MTNFDNELFDGDFTKRFGKTSLIDLTKKVDVGTAGTFISTPAETLNVALEIGGIKKGAIVEFFGPESSGKTTLGLEVLKSVQQQTGLPVMAIDAEHAFNKKYCATIGMDIRGDMFKFIQENETEKVLNMVLVACQSGMGAVLVDSIPALTAKAQLEDIDVTDSRMGGNAKLLSNSLGRIKSISEQTGTVVIFVNQIRYKIGAAAAYGNPETTPGGKALPYFTDLRVRTSIAQTPDYLIADKANGDLRGVRIKAELKKHKFGTPHRIAHYDIIFGKGIDRLGSIVDAAISAQMITKSGSWYSFHGKQIGQGKPAVRTMLEQNPEVVEEIRVALWTKNELQ